MSKVRIPFVREVLFSTAVLTILFHKQSIGLNLVVAEILLLLSMIYSKALIFNTFTQRIILIGILSSALATLVTHSTFSYILHFISIFLWIGVLILPELKSLLTAAELAFSSLADAFKTFFDTIKTRKQSSSGTLRLFYYFKIFIIPILIVLVFIFIYQSANPVFSDGLTWVLNKVDSIITLFTKNLDFSIVFTILIAFIISVLFWVRSKNDILIINEMQALFYMKRKKIITRNNNGILALKTEWKSGIALLLMLNILLGVVNIIDIQWVWFNFEWEGQYLKQFVHQGTYMLIVSIIISIVVVGFLFRANLNFYKKNKTLKFLAVTFLAQNAVLLFSVGLRNWYYIEHYALAYKRVGVVFFLLITLALLISLAFKITKLKSNYWFVTVNSWSVWIILIVGSYFNWDVIIAKYNANHAGVSFYHFNFMVDRADKSLPYLIMNFDDLKRIETYQNEKFPVHNSYLSAEEYQNKVKHRIWAFKSEWEDKSILEWNYAEYKAYNKLKELDLIEELKNIDSSN